MNCEQPESLAYVSLGQDLGTAFPDAIQLSRIRNIFPRRYGDILFASPAAQSAMAFAGKLYLLYGLHPRLYIDPVRHDSD